MTPAISWPTGFLLPHRRGTPLFNIIALLWLSSHEVKPTAIFVFMLNINSPQKVTLTLSLYFQQANSQLWILFVQHFQKYELYPFTSACYFHLHLLIALYANCKPSLFSLRHVAVNLALEISVCECKVATSHKTDCTYIFHICLLFDSFILCN